MATNPDPWLRALTWWTKGTKREWGSAIVGFTTIIIVALTLFSDSRNSTTPSSTFDLHSSDDLVPLTLLYTAQATGAFCLDGSLPGYHFQNGFGSGSANWLLHLEGGGWCNSIETCNARKGTALGSSKYMDGVQFDGILSPHPTQNPDFYNWNRVKIRYCDGASFAGHPESEFKNGTELFFRGQLIWEAIMKELLSLGLSEAKQVMDLMTLQAGMDLEGCTSFRISAGGLASFIHCDAFRDHLPKNATVKCLADAGFFLNEPDVLGNRTILAFYHDIVQLQGVAKSLGKNCVEIMEPCFFPQEIIKNVRIPFFIVNPAYDSWQIQNILVPVASDPQGYWSSCRLSIQKCDSTQIEDYKTVMDETWHSPHSPRINNKTIAESVGDWYFNREVSKQIDCPYPCNPHAITWTSRNLNQEHLQY
ncbi:Pectin acetylesterase 5 [Hibiscus syriacus]|uniref:Pectin acetylesterase n=1 Tax=Hibiscus syriacus TaxID=106335 RepID=A0A6A3CI85_HIBSY|nr:Pectin acetylesterase 5 [Hibiscus syriacus]